MFHPNDPNIHSISLKIFGETLAVLFSCWIHCLEYIFKTWKWNNYDNDSNFQDSRQTNLSKGSVFDTLFIGFCVKKPLHQPFEIQTNLWWLTDISVSIDSGHYELHIWYAIWLQSNTILRNFWYGTRQKGYAQTRFGRLGLYFFCRPSSSCMEIKFKGGNIPKLTSSRGQLVFFKRSEHIYRKVGGWTNPVEK